MTPLEYLTIGHSILSSIFILFDVALVVGIVYAFPKAWEYRPSIKPGKVTRAGSFASQSAVFRERWEAVMKRFSFQSSESMRLAIIEADVLADSILKELGFEGENMADRLSKISPESLSCLDNLFRAHKTRNELVHEPDKTISHDIAQQTIEDYESFLKEIKVI